MTDKWAAYMRVSKDEQKTENQRPEIEQYLERRGITADFYEEHESTRKTRPIKQELLQKVRKGEYAGVIVWQLSRWARSMSELTPELQYFADNGVHFVSVRDLFEYNPKSPTAKLMMNIIGSFAEFERDMIRERTLAGLARAKSQGKRLGRPKGSKDTKDRNKSGYYLRYAGKKTSAAGSASDR